MKKRKTKNQKTIKPKKHTKKVIKVKTKGVKKDKVVSFLNKRKDINDKFFDLVDKKISFKRVQPKKQKNKKRKKPYFRRVGIGNLAKELEVSTSTIRRYIKQGYINTKNDELFINVERNFDSLKIKKTKKTTKQFTTHNFTKDNFFEKSKIGKLKKNQQVFFRCGLYLQFNIKNYSSTRRKYSDGKYTIQNLPLSHYSNSYSRGFDEFFMIIKEEIDNHPSIEFFRFNYFSVTIVNID